MILVVVSHPAERSALVSLCETRSCPATPCATFRELRSALGLSSSRVVIVRQRLTDGTSEDVIRFARQHGASGPRVIVLLSAAANSESEARHVSLGADAVLRDPVRIEVLLAYMERYKKERPLPPRASRAYNASFPFAGLRIDPRDRVARRGSRAVRLTPREVALAQQLALSPGQVVDYAALFHDILGRPYRGDTSNMRVLLGKLAASLTVVGGSVRDHVEVIPKTGYRYLAPTA
jgi:DNA-binding response OmpR family regulator